MNTFAAFRSRSECLRLHAVLTNKGFASTIINTPRRQGLSCGISILFHDSVQGAVEALIRAMKLTSFYGFYKK